MTDKNKDAISTINILIIVYKKLDQNDASHNELKRDLNISPIVGKIKLFACSDEIKIQITNKEAAPKVPYMI